MTNENQVLALTNLNQPLINVILSGDQGGVSKHLAQYKQRGEPCFPELLKIPSKIRIPALLLKEDGREYVFKALVAALLGAFSQINLRVSMNEEQVCELAEAIIEESHEDNLSIEDVLVFLQQLMTGKAGKIYDRMDMPTFFDMFEGYRQQRHRAYLNAKYEKEQNYKVQGDTNRWSNSDDRTKNREAMNEYLRTTYCEGNTNEGPDH